MRLIGGKSVHLIWQLLPMPPSSMGKGGFGETALSHKPKEYDSEYL